MERHRADPDSKQLTTSLPRDTGLLGVPLQAWLIGGTAVPAAQNARVQFRGSPSAFRSRRRRELSRGLVRPTLVRQRGAEPAAAGLSFQEHFYQ